MELFAYEWVNQQIFYHICKCSRKHIELMIYKYSIITYSRLVHIICQNWTCFICIYLLYLWFDLIYLFTTFV